MRYTAVLLAALLCFFSAALMAQTFPLKPLRLVLRAPPGGTDDLLGRLISLKMGEILGQQIIVDYRTGAGGLVAWEYIAKAPPDGYTVLLAASGLGAIKSLRPEATIDPWRDFTWVSQVVNYQLVLVAHPSVPAKTLKDLIALAHGKPGQMSYGSSGIGATPHLSAEYFKAAAKVNILHVPYKGAGPMYVDLMGGRIELAMAVSGSAIPHVKAGKIRALGVSGAKRVPQLPDVPTIAEGGVPGYEFTAFYALLAPGGTPREIVARLADATAKTVASPEYRTRVIDAGMEPVSNTPEQMLQAAKIDAAKIDKIVRTANIKPE
ncbi:MAG TPA: tripartite tricarboxylate transporter substrate binding protein [Burkholderiales bacterium]|nr:tripartite tricarboxylate transporter substrate binding protein [Burkholderiales bacterium]